MAKTTSPLVYLLQSICILIAALLCLISSAEVQAQSIRCGGENQRGCCLLKERKARGLSGPCEPGLYEDLSKGCTRDCACSVWPFQSAGMCRRRIPITPCGGPGQRACCWLEKSFGTCRDGLIEDGNCKNELGKDKCVCKGGAPSIGVCREPQCGGPNERGCCIGKERAIAGHGGPCQAGLIEDLSTPCRGPSCRCLGSEIRSSGMCRRITSCGERGERACCVGTGEFAPGGGSCTEGNIEVPGCKGECYCGNLGTGQRSSGRCEKFEKTTPCGGEGQRACCAGTFEVLPGKACDPGLVEIPGCTSNCLCGGVNPLKSVFSSGICVKPSPCGGEGQRACCVGITEHASGGGSCGPGLRELPGCTGDCFCGGALATGQSASGMCAGSLEIEEPQLNHRPAQTAKRCPYRGYADLHLHMFSNMAFGGATIHGETYSPTGGPNEALRQCFGTDEEIRLTIGTKPLPPACPSYFPNCGKYLYHGNHFNVLDDPIGLGTGDKSGHVGAPTFGGWPRASSTTHQKVYYRWLERAYRGGLRLVSILAVENHAMCQGNKRKVGVDCSDTMKSVEAQIDAAYDLERWLDQKAGGEGRGWFRIVTSAQEAMQAMQDDKLAVVLGIEESALFGCNKGRCTESMVEAQLDRWLDKGVRHFFPIHNFDNDFGGTANWNDIVNIGNFVANDKFLDAEECSSEGFGFRFNTNAGLWLLKVLGYGNFDIFPNYNQKATCNPKGLTLLGRFVVEKMMDRGVLIDIDHMSRHAIDDVLDIAERRNYPLLASHVVPVGTIRVNGVSERMRTDAQLERLNRLGSVVAPILLQDKSDLDYGVVENDCDGSTTTLSMAYQYLADTMSTPVALGSDFNGMAGHVTPRYGPLACRGGDPKVRSKQYQTRDKLEYPFSLDEFGTFDRQKSGVKRFDFNYDGLAHIGLLPDMVADLSVVGLPREYVDEIFSSAQGFVDMWAKAEGSYVPTPRASCVNKVVVAQEGCRVQVNPVNMDTKDPRIDVQISKSGSLGLGTHNIQVRVEDLCGEGGVSRCVSRIEVVDRQAPQLMVPAPNQVYVFEDASVAALDKPIVWDGCDDAPILEHTTMCFPGGSQSPAFNIRRWTARDASGNEAVAYQAFSSRQCEASQGGRAARTELALNL